MKLFTIIAVTTVAFSASVLAAVNANIFTHEIPAPQVETNMSAQELASLSPGSGTIGKYTIPSSAPATAVLQSYAESSKPDVSKLAKTCQSKADAVTTNGKATAASQDVYYNCLCASLKPNIGQVE